MKCLQNKILEQESKERKENEEKQKAQFDKEQRRTRSLEAYSKIEKKVSFFYDKIKLFTFKEYNGPEAIYQLHTKAFREKNIYIAGRLGLYNKFIRSLYEMDLLKDLTPLVADEAILDFSEVRIESKKDLIIYCEKLRTRLGVRTLGELAKLTSEDYFVALSMGHPNDVQMQDFTAENTILDCYHRGVTGFDLESEDYLEILNSVELHKERYFFRYVTHWADRFFKDLSIKYYSLEDERELSSISIEIYKLVSSQLNLTTEEIREAKILYGPYTQNLSKLSHYQIKFLSEVTLEIRELFLDIKNADIPFKEKRELNESLMKLSEHIFSKDYFICNELYFNAGDLKSQVLTAFRDTPPNFFNKELVNYFDKFKVFTDFIKFKVVNETLSTKGELSTIHESHTMWKYLDNISIPKDVSNHNSDEITILITSLIYFNISINRFLRSNGVSVANSFVQGISSQLSSEHNLSAEEQVTKNSDEKTLNGYLLILLNPKYKNLLSIYDIFYYLNELVNLVDKIESETEIEFCMNPEIPSLDVKTIDDLKTRMLDFAKPVILKATEPFVGLDDDNDSF